MHNEIVVDMRVASGLGRGVYHTTDHAEPIGSGEQVRLDVPIASNDPRPFERLDARGGLLKYGKVSLREPFAILEVNANHIDAPPCRYPRPTRLAGGA